MVADDYRDLGTKILMPLAKISPLGPMGISLLSLITALTAGYSFYVGDLDSKLTDSKRENSCKDQNQS